MAAAQGRGLNRGDCGSAADTFGPSLEGVIAGSADDEIWDSAADEDIWGGPGNDEISAYAGGSDYIRGEAGNDRIIDGGGNDTIDYGDESESGGTVDAGGGFDTITYAARAQGIDVFWGGTSYASYINPGHLSILTRIEKIVGSPYADEISGGDGVSTDQAITVDGGAGNDTIGGGYQGDVLIGGAGIDVLSGGNGNDSLQTKEGTAGDQLTCGAGVDTASLDTLDTISVPADCETKTY